MTDPYDLQRFVAAQEQTYQSALAELRSGRKTSHWMWFVFPQVQGLGRSPMAQRFALRGLDEARAYLEHPVLGQRLRECVSALLEHAVAERSAGRRPDPVAVLGPIDAVKLRSSMTLFAAVEATAGTAPGTAPGTATDTDDDPFHQVLQTYFDGVPDQATLDRLEDA